MILGRQKAARLKSLGAKTLIKRLRQQGAQASLRLAVENAKALATAAEVSKRLDIPASTLRKWKASNRAIAFRPPCGSRDLFPLAQFSEKAVAPWVSGIIATLGNGAAAFHFLLVPRRSLAGASYSRRLLDGDLSIPARIEANLRRIELD